MVGKGCEIGRQPSLNNLVCGGSCLACVHLSRTVVQVAIIYQITSDQSHQINA